LVGMESESSGGLGEVSHDELPRFMCRYRFIFNPIRYTSLGLAVCEAMSLGVPIVGLATTEMVTAVKNDVNGYVDTDVNALIQRMRHLLAHPEEAARLSEHARETGRTRFGIKRFSADWDRTLRAVVHQHATARSATWKLSEPVAATMAGDLQ